MIALVGGDGAGKTTALSGLRAWLSKEFDVVAVHLGKPRWSLTTTCVRGALKLGRLLRFYPEVSTFRETLTQKSLVSPGYPWLLCEVCRARDRYRTYLKARRSVAKGGIVICDRFPLPQVRIMDGKLASQFTHKLADGSQAKGLMRPHPSSRLTQFLVRLEESYYRPFMPPDLLLVLRVDPEIAVKRKTDEDPCLVRERSTEIWELNWEQTDAHVIDASVSTADVLAQVKEQVWSVL